MYYAYGEKIKRTKIIGYLKEYLPEYDFCKGTAENLEVQYKLKRSNADFFAKVQNHPVTMEECREDLTACPPHFPQEQQYYWMIYEKGICIAVLAYLEGYPDDKTVYIGLLMVDAARHRMGIGRKINDAFMRGAAKCGYSSIRLGCYRANESGYRFWRRNRYVAEKMTETETDGNVYPLLHMVCDISDRHMFETEEERNELAAGAFEKMRGGHFLEADVFKTLKWEEAEELNKSFPYMAKIKLPGQWD